MKIKESEYDQLLDFACLEQAMEKLPAGDVAIRDLASFDTELLNFFSTVIKADSTKDLEQFSTEYLLDKISMLSKSAELISALSPLIKDTSILSSEKKLTTAFNERRLRALRRVL